MLGALLVLWPAVPASGQVLFVPDQPATAFRDTPGGWVGAGYGRGLSDGSGRFNTIQLVLGRRSDRVAGMVGIGRAGGEPSLGGALAMQLPGDDGVELSAQVGLGWVGVDEADASTVRAPIGLALARSSDREDATLRLWAMPRVEVLRTVVSGLRDTDLVPGLSAGAAVTGDRGIGLSVAVDGALTDPFSTWLLGVGFHWTSEAIREAFGGG